MIGEPLKIAVIIPSRLPKCIRHQPSRGLTFPTKVRCGPALRNANHIGLWCDVLVDLMKILQLVRRKGAARSEAWQLFSNIDARPRPTMAVWRKTYEETRMSYRYPTGIGLPPGHGPCA